MMPRATSALSNAARVAGMRPEDEMVVATGEAHELADLDRAFVELQFAGLGRATLGIEPQVCGLGPVNRQVFRVGCVHGARSTVPRSS